MSFSSASNVMSAPLASSIPFFNSALPTSTAQPEAIDNHATNDKGPEAITSWLQSGSPLVKPAGNLTLTYQVAKRVFDICGAVVLLVLFAPLMLLTLLLLWVTTPGRPIFVQERVGHCGRRFRMIKFRTMSLDAEARKHLIKNEQAGPVFKNRSDPRVTRIGRILRSTSVDEMPQLINVLLGDMALVGPRPPVVDEVARYQPWQCQRLAVKPGLTCLWQVSGRNEVAFDRWVRMDLWYLKHQSLITDLILLLRTPLSVLSRRGAY